MPRRRSKYGYESEDMDSRSAIEKSLQRWSSTFAVSVFRSKKTGQVLYLEAGKEFVDTLLSFLLLSAGTIIHMLSIGVPQAKHVGGISSIFESVEKLDSSLLHFDRNKILVQPRPVATDAGLSKSTTSIGLLLLCLDPDAKKQTPSKKKLFLPEHFYKCDNCTTLSGTKGARCYFCWPENRLYNGNYRCREGPYYLSAEDLKVQEAIISEQDPVEEADSSSGQGFVKENITFMITNKLEIMPSTTTTSMSVLSTLKVVSLADLESNKVTVTITQVLQLLQSALTASNSCLNDVFGIGENITTIPGETSSREIDHVIAGLHIQGRTPPK